MRRDALAPTPVEGLSLIPAGAGLAGANVELPRIEGFEQRLKDALESIRE